MSYVLSIRYHKKKDHWVPLSGAYSFDDYWLPLAAKLDLKYIPKFSWLKIASLEMLEAVAGELQQLHDYVANVSDPEIEPHKLADIKSRTENAILAMREAQQNWEDVKSMVFT